MATTREAQKTAAGDLGHLLDAGDGAVVTLVAGDTRLAAHRAVLEARSPVFESVFGHTTLEATSRQFKVRNVEGPLLRRLVAYCYTLQASQLLSMDPQLLEAADKLGLSGLKDVTDQQTPTVRLGSLLDARSDAIVTLVAGETRLQVHRSVLETRSPGFKSMFGQSKSDQFLVTNVEGPVLRQLVAYCYTLQAPQLPEMAFQLLAAAATYGLSDLKDACEQQAVRQLTVENAIEAGVLAVRHSCFTLKQAAVAFLKTHIHEVVTTQGWYANKRRYPHDLLDLTQLILSAETRTPATAEGAPITSTDRQLQSDCGQSPATAAAAVAPPTASRRTPTPDNNAVSYKQAPATAEGGPTPGSHRQPNASLGRQTPAAAATPTAPRHTPPPDDAAVARFRRLSQRERNSRLVQAAKRRAAPELRALLAAGADVGARDEGWWTALHCAAEGGHEEAARCLVEGGAEVDARSRWQRQTPLHLAADSGHAAVVRLLLAASADPNARDRWGRTPLHRAALNGEAEVAAALVQGGADTGARDDDGRTPLDIARQKNKQQLIQLLTQ